MIQNGSNGCFFKSDEQIVSIIFRMTEIGSFHEGTRKGGALHNGWKSVASTHALSCLN